MTKTRRSPEERLEALKRTQEEMSVLDGVDLKKITRDASETFLQERELRHKIFHLVYDLAHPKDFI